MIWKTYSCNLVYENKIVLCPEYDTKLYLMVRLHFWRSGSVEYLFIDITPRSTLT